ncbi:MAG TPA: hypothetical protein VKG05_03685, partial [Steroidobacteraceae bacterium]|nr:hypothetical protein [Steroidobacteraceae bacterium]
MAASEAPQFQQTNCGGAVGDIVSNTARTESLSDGYGRRTKMFQQGKSRQQHNSRALRFVHN